MREKAMPLERGWPKAGPNSLPLPSNLIGVPPIRQCQDFTCGVAATLMLLRYWCVDGCADVEESALYEPLQTTRVAGTEPGPMVDLSRRKGLFAYYRNGDVRVDELGRAVMAGEPPILDLQAWRDDDTPWRETWDAGHYVVLVGYDEERLYVADPSRATRLGYAFLSRSELDDRWHDLTRADERVERMAIFVRGELTAAPPPTDRREG
jgi:ABC-type bacteriocin/lantibiotic exporter with double-glycine peptidase domain